MRRAHTLILLLLLMLCLTAGLVIVALASSIHTTSAALPTLAVLPTTTQPPTATRTFTPTVTATPSDTPTPTNTPTATTTFTPTVTPTLAVRLLEMNAVMPGVYLPLTLTPIPSGMRVLPAPPFPFEPLPEATHEAPPYLGWYSFESDHPLVSYSTRWQARQVREASQGQYHRTENTSSFATFPFEGEGFRVRYVAAQNMGLFDILVDGVRIDRIDAYSPNLHFPGTQVYFVGSGLHNLTLRSSGHKNADSEGMVVGLDAIQVFRGDANLLIIPPSQETAMPTPVLIPARNIELIGVPPTVLPTATPLTPQQIDISVVIAYDENGNRDVDPAEGVSGISVRVVEVDNNHVITQAFTDAQGYAHMQIMTADDTRVVVPYFGQVWDVPRGRQDGEAAFTLLLEPGNQPGLIP